MRKRFFGQLTAVLMLTLFLAGSMSSATTVSKRYLRSSSEVTVHYIDVGQGDSIFIQLPNGKTILIDAGGNGCGDIVLDYIKKCGVSKIDAIIATHPHEDHIGGLDDVINGINVGSVYMPNATATTKTYKALIAAIESKGLKVTRARAGVSLNLDNTAQAVMAGPNADKYSNVNNYSAVLRLAYGNTALLFTGDAEELAEEEMLAKGANLKADVLKVGHHGSDTATGDEFLTAVAPAEAVICVGTGNKYGHPHQSTLTKLSKVKINIYRTDKSGTIVARDDGSDITFQAVTSRSLLKSNRFALHPVVSRNSAAGQTYIIDRFEGKYAVLESGERFICDAPASLLPSNAKEGDVITFDVKGTATVNKVATAENRAGAQALLKTVMR